jgi:maltooligosyltrehalose trehalohydrolase
MSVKLVLPVENIIAMQKDEAGYWRAVVGNVSPGTLYYYQLNGKHERPDPTSFYQPNGVHGASQVIDHNVFFWEDSGWQGIRLSEMIMYELHTGTFTPEGTFDAIITRLDDLKDLGINAIEIMPVSQFPGNRNWGYDGAYPYAVQNSYGGPDGLKRLVNESHKKGFAVILDVVYNHLGPEGNYLRDFGPYFTDRYSTAWGKAINFDGPDNRAVRNYFIENALYWFEHYHIDALRLDAIHGIHDKSHKHILAELSERVAALSREHGRRFYLIAESDLNNPEIARARNVGGSGIDAVWCDDFHHSCHTLLTDERNGYYCDFGSAEHLVKSLNEGFVYTGQYSRFRKKNHGSPSKDLPPENFVVFTQNHDQVGNRMMGERLSSLVSFESQKLAAGIVILSPYIPLLFMGEEYGETNPFLFFVSHSDRQLIEGVRAGRRREFIAFNWQGEPPDPQSVETYEKSRIDWKKRARGNNKVMLKFYKELIRLRKTMPVLSFSDRKNIEVRCEGNSNVVFMRKWSDNNHVFSVFNFTYSKTGLTVPDINRRWHKVIDSADSKWNGPGSMLPESPGTSEEITISPESFVLYKNQ